MTLTFDEVARLDEMLAVINEDKLQGWDLRFIRDFRMRYDNEGADIHVTPKQWIQLERIHGKC